MAASLCRRGFLNYRSFLFQVQKRTGYVVLIPEAPNEVADFSVISLENLPDFSLLKLKTCKQLFHQYAQQYDLGSWEINEHLEQQLQKPEKVDVFKNVIEPLEVLTVPFLTTWGVIRTLFTSQNNTIGIKNFITFTDRVVQIRNDKFDRESLYIACKKHLEANDNTTEEQKRVMKKFIWEGLHNGFELNTVDQGKLKKCYEILERKRKAYESKYLNSLTQFSHIISDEAFKESAPADLLRLSAVRKTPDVPPWKITLRPPVYWRYMEYCSSREARFSLWLGFNQVASNFLDASCNATFEVENIRQKRQEVAEILGFPTYAHLSMHTKMAESVEKVQMVLNELLESAKFGQEKEVYELEKFAQENGFKYSLEMWDLPYWKRRWQDHKIGLDEQKLKEYFPVGQVLLGLIALCEQLFGIEIQEQRAVDCWAPDVRYFRIVDEKTKSILGGFYFDPYASNEKSVPGIDKGCFIPIRPRSRIIASLPLSALIFSFTPPTEDTPSLLYYTDIQNLFGKFGQMLQFTLTEANYSEVSGLSNVEWDAVENCSHFLKFWLTEKGTLESISGHYKTGEPLPSQALEGLCNIHKHMAGTDLSRDIYFSNLDLYMHLRADGVLDLVKNLWPQHFLFALHKNDSHAFGFKEVFLTPLGSSVYSDIWSKMVAADVFWAFVEAGLSNHEEVSVLGRRFRSTFLSLGGGCDASEVFRRFRGRDPDPKSLISLLELPTAAFFQPSADEPQLALPETKLGNNFYYNSSSIIPAAVMALL